MLNMNWLVFSFRNVIKNFRRSIISIIIVAFGVASILISYGFIQESFVGLANSMIQGGIGHIQIGKKDSFKGNKNAKKYLLSLKEIKGIEKFLENRKEVKFTIRRVFFEGLISNGFITIGTLAMGSTLDDELRLAGIFSPIVDGYLGNAKTDPNFIVMGKEMAEILGIKIGSKISVLGTMLDGGINALDLKVMALSSTGIPEQDQRQIMMPSQTAIELLGGEVFYNKFVIILNNLKDIHEINKLLKDNYPNLEIKNWEEIATFYTQVVSLYTKIFSFFVLIIVGLILVSISSVVLTSVMERVPEIGVLLSLGIKKSRVALNFVEESYIIGLIGAVLGVIIGFIISIVVSNIGIMMPPPPGRTVGYPLLIGVYFNFALLLILVVPVLCALVSYIPTKSIFRLKIVDALRHD